MTDVSRRTVLAGGVAAGGLMVLGLDVGAADAASATTSPLPLRSDYHRAVGKIFTATHGKHTYRLRLQRIHDVSHATAAQAAHSFTLVFAPVGSTRVPDQIYRLRSPHVRTHELFLSAVGRGHAMQALINRTR